MLCRFFSLNSTGLIQSVFSIFKVLKNDFKEAPNFLIAGSLISSTYHEFDRALLKVFVIACFTGIFFYPFTFRRIRDH
ncbi:hypothetical protein B1J93_16445 [Leptospira kirschneri serovar Pomona]|uniref:Uncharacterized protein n=1 Tax=Leptospira kirschneri serovar Pomona TaxID=561005 RepID=A0A1T1DJD7_9LEPT|nr:hypothetical protein B1J93_16445 [Leptospira kirschneri serovar Pomona]